MAVDPHRQFASPYLGMGNNPINGVDPDGRDWYDLDGEIVWLNDFQGDFTDATGGFHRSLGSNELIVGTHNRSINEGVIAEPINSATFQLYRATESTTGPIATITGNTVPADPTTRGTLVPGIYFADFESRAGTGDSDLAVILRDPWTWDNELQNHSFVGLSTTSYSEFVTGRVTIGEIFIHRANNYRGSLFDSKNVPYSTGCQTTGCYEGSHDVHAVFFSRVGRDFDGYYYLRGQRPKLSPPSNGMVIR